MVQNAGDQGDQLQTGEALGQGINNIVELLDRGVSEGSLSRQDESSGTANSCVTARYSWEKPRDFGKYVAEVDFHGLQIARMVVYESGGYPTFEYCLRPDGVTEVTLVRDPVVKVRIDRDGGCEVMERVTATYYGDSRNRGGTNIYAVFSGSKESPCSYSGMTIIAHDRGLSEGEQVFPLSQDAWHHVLERPPVQKVIPRRVLDFGIAKVHEVIQGSSWKEGTSLEPLPVVRICDWFGTAEGDIILIRNYGEKGQGLHFCRIGRDGSIHTVLVPTIAQSSTLDDTDRAAYHFVIQGVKVVDGNESPIQLVKTVTVPRGLTHLRIKAVDEINADGLDPRRLIELLCDFNI